MARLVWTEIDGDSWPDLVPDTPEDYREEDRSQEEEKGVEDQD